MRLIKVSVAGLVLAGILAVAPTAAFARGGGGGGGHGGGGSGFGGGHGGGGGHAGGFAGHGFAPHGWHGGHYWAVVPGAGMEITIGMIIRTTAMMTTMTATMSRRLLPCSRS